MTENSIQKPINIEQLIKNTPHIKIKLINLFSELHKLISDLPDNECENKKDVLNKIDSFRNEFSDADE